MGYHQEADSQEEIQCWPASGRSRKNLERDSLRLEDGMSLVRPAAKIWILHYLLAETQGMATSGNLGENLEETASNAG
jgi:hypothetical protein